MQGLEIGGMIFEWDDAKAAFNIEKHGISFYEAASVFRDRRGILLPDIEHSQDEDRFLLIGLTGEQTIDSGSRRSQRGFKDHQRTASCTEREERL